MWSEPDKDAFGGARDFRTTHWSVVLQAGASVSPEQHSALERLCRAYWYPLYSFVRRRGHDAHEAQDLTQAFFARFLQKNYLADVSADKGKFRSFLLAALQHFLANEWDRTRAQKRGSGAAAISLDEQDAEERFHFEPPDELTPEKAFERVGSRRCWNRFFFGCAMSAMMPDMRIGLRRSRVSSWMRKAPCLSRKWRNA